MYLVSLLRYMSFIYVVIKQFHSSKINAISLHLISIHNPCECDLCVCEQNTLHSPECSLCEVAIENTCWLTQAQTETVSKALVITSWLEKRINHYLLSVVVLLNSYSYCLLIILLLPHRLSLVVADGHQPLSPVLPEVFSCSEAVYSHHCCQLFTHGRLTGLCKWIKECCLDPLNLLSMMRWLLLWTGATGIKIDCLIFLKHKLFE